MEDRKLSYWQNKIKEATGCTDADAPEVENYMLASEYRMSELSKRQFNNLAKGCYVALIWSRTDEGKAYKAQCEKEFYGE